MIAIISLAGIGILAMATVQEAMGSELGGLLFRNKIIYMLLGTAVLFGCYFLDYRKLKPLTSYLYGGAIVVMGLTLLLGTEINGTRSWLAIGPLGFRTGAVAVLLLLISLSGATPARQWGKRTNQLYQLTLRYLLPAGLLAATATLPYVMLYTIGFIVFVWTTRTDKKQLLLLSLPILSGAVIFVTRDSSLFDRISEFLSRDARYNYHSVEMVKAVQSAGWTGHGFASRIDTLPYIYSESILPYFIYCFGWAAGLFLVSVIFIFVARLWHMLKRLHDHYATVLGCSLLVYFGFQFMWPLLASFGVLPVISMEIPFIAYGGTTQILHFAAAGLWMSLYRRKNRIASAGNGELA
nr:FtsW/RodA/SpoVE family cell cycle protein [Paenibacillus turpanensis]